MPLSSIYGRKVKPRKIERSKSVSKMPKKTRMGNGSKEVEEVEEEEEVGGTYGMKRTKDDAVPSGQLLNCRTSLRLLRNFSAT